MLEYFDYSQNINYTAKLNIDYTYSTGGIDHRITINDSIGLVDFIGKAPVRKPSDNLVITDSISKKITVNGSEFLNTNYASWTPIAYGTFNIAAYTDFKLRD